ncbi:hypothetical protein EYF80_004045 [Liparis tanakae]|uniref:Uncharacterized protein n=1 Tax=Liparis tanakae TaxID=230148 RepID=A0A4Z2J7X9_9TELE|nr:hypothetical protein EYF80_004045 [Liparis tanakae]
MEQVRGWKLALPQLSPPQAFSMKVLQLRLHQASSSNQPAAAIPRSGFAPAFNLQSELPESTSSHPSRGCQLLFHTGITVLMGVSSVAGTVCRISSSQHVSQREHTENASEDTETYFIEWEQPEADCEAAAREKPACKKSTFLGNSSAPSCAHGEQQHQQHRRLQRFSDAIGEEHPSPTGCHGRLSLDISASDLCGQAFNIILFVSSHSLPYRFVVS